MAEIIFNFERQIDKRIFYSNNNVFFVDNKEIKNEEISLSASWEQTSGMYVYAYLEKYKDIKDSFFQNLFKFISCIPDNVLVLWIENPEASYTKWKTQYITANKQIKDTKAISATLNRYTSIGTEKYMLSILGGVEISCDDDLTGLVFKSNEGNSLSFKANDMHFFSADKIKLPLSGDCSGCLQFQFLIPYSKSSNIFQDIDAGIKYCTLYENIEDSLTVSMYGGVHTISMNALEPNMCDVYIIASVHPVFLLNSNLTYFEFSNKNSLGFNSKLSTLYGQKLQLVPVENSRAGLVFNRIPIQYSKDDQIKAGQFEYYLAPMGQFKVIFPKEITHMYRSNIGVSKIEYIACGLSGTEFIGFNLDDNEEPFITFVPGNNGFYDRANSTKENLLSDIATTSWIKFSLNAEYYASPKKAPFFKPSSNKNILSYLEVPALKFDDNTGAFPMGLYVDCRTNFDNGTVTEKLEVEGIAATRSSILLGEEVDNGINKTLTNAPIIGITNQGNLAYMNSGTDYQWQKYCIASNSDNNDNPDVCFSYLKSKMVKLLQDNNLFLPITNADVFMDQYASIPYKVTEEAKTKIEELVGENDAKDAIEKAEKMGSELYICEADFLEAINNCGGMKYKEAYLKACGTMSISLSDWLFDFSPRNWRKTASNTNTMVILKYTNDKSIKELMEDELSWAALEIASHSASKDIFDEAVAAAYNNKAELISEYENFISIVNNPQWCGVLVLNCPLDVLNIPQELQVIMSGINKDDFYAHHMGININGFEVIDEHISVNKSSVFGLINYTDGKPIVNESSEIPDFQFTTTKLTLEVVNSSISGFKCESELLINKLFGTSVSKYPTKAGNCLILKGTYQTVDVNNKGYVFSLRENGTFYLMSGAISSVEVNNVQMSISSSDDGMEAGSTCIFSLAGKLRLYKDTNCDLLSFGVDTIDSLEGESDNQSKVVNDGYLSFRDLIISMEIDTKNNETNQAIKVQMDKLAFDLTNSRYRANSFAANFPAIFDSMITSYDAGNSNNNETVSPAELGYIAINCPIKQQKLEDKWNGIVYKISLGSMGALANDKEIMINILIAWNLDNSSTEPGFYVGVKLPGLVGKMVQFDIQGIIKLNFKTVELLTENKIKNNKTIIEYKLQFRNFALRVLGFAFPPGNNDIFIFADTEKGNMSKLGWYAGYVGEKGRVYD